MNWDYLVIALVSYGFGMWVNGYTWRKKAQTPPWSSKYWYTCDECMPGVTQKIGADTQSHLEQMVSWHHQDYHAFERSGEIIKKQIDHRSPYRGTYEPKTKKLVLLGKI